MAVHLILFFILGYSVVYVVYQRYFSPLAGIPGPFEASISRFWLVKRTRRGLMHRDLIKLHERHGPLVRIAPGELSVADPQAFKKIYGAGSKFPKSKWYDTLQAGRKFDLFAEQDEHVHSSQRRLVSRIYALDNLKDLEPYVDATVSSFMQKMREMQGSSIDIGKWLQLFAFDVIGEVTFSQPFGFMSAQQDDGIFVRIQQSVASGMWLAHVPWFYQLHQFLMPVIGNHLAANDREGTIRDYTAREVENRYSRGSDRPDILGKLFEIHKERPSELERNNIVSVASSNVGAGSDTTAISLRAIIHFLLLHPDKKAKLMQEIDEVARSQNIRENFSYDQAREMAYLQAVMYDSMRLYPAIGNNLPKTTPIGGLTIGERFIPSGTIVGTSAWVLHRNKDVFGEDAETFRPERWLVEKDKGDLQRYFFSIGGGSRTCIGRNISWLEMAKLVPTLFYHFDLYLVNPEKPLHEECSFFVQQTGLLVRVMPREKIPEL